MLDHPNENGGPFPAARELFRGSSEAILVHDPADGCILDANPAAQRLYGYTREELVGESPEGLLADGPADLSALADGDETVGWHTVGPDDDHRWVDVRVTHSPASDTILSFGRDSTGWSDRDSEHPFKRLQEIVSKRDVDFEGKVEALLELGRDWLGLSVAYMTRIDRAVQTVDAAVGDHPDIQSGETAPLSETYCQHTLASADSETTVHRIESAAEAGMLDSDEYERFGLSCYLGGTITVDDESYGTVCFADTEPRERPFTDRERAFVDLLTQWTGLTVERQRQASKLREEHELTTAILGSSPTGILVCDEVGAVTLANDRATELLGEGGELDGRAEIPVTMYDEGGRRLSAAELPQRRVADGETLSNVQYRLDDTRYVSISGRPLAASQRGGVVLTVEDVTDQRRHIDAMRALSDTLASATGSFDDQLRELLDLGRTHLNLDNGHLTEIEDDRHELIVSEGLPDLLPVGAVSELETTFCQSIVETGGMCNVTAASEQFPETDPVRQWGIETYIGTAVIVDGEMYGTLCFVAEEPRERSFAPWEKTFVETLGRWVETVIQQRRNAAERDRDRALLEGVFNSQRTQVGILDTDGTVVDANDAALSFVDAPRAAIEGVPVWETPWFAGEPAHSRCRRGVELAADGEMTDFEVNYAGDGEETVFSVNIRPVFEDDTVINVVVEAHDITALRRREQELERRQRHIDTILNNAPLVLFALDESGEFLHSRGRALAAFGLEDGELVGKNINEVYADEPEIIEDFERAREGEPVESVRTVGETVFRTWYRPVEIDGATNVIGISIDITEQQRQKQRVAAVNEAAEALMYARTPPEVGETLVDIVGELISYPLAAVWVPEANGESLVPVAATDQTVAAIGGDSAADALPTIEAGSVEMSVFESGESRVVEDYGDIEGEWATRTPARTVVMVPLGEYGHLHVASTDQNLPSDTELDLIGILARNAEAALVSTNREVELEAYKDELERSNRALQEFAYIASHDLQEPLRMVSSYVDLLEMEYGDQLDDEATEYIDFAVDGARRMQNMIDALLQYSRVETQGNAFERVEMAAVVETTLDALRLRVDETDATVEVGALPAVEADPNQLGQLFQNLLENAIEYADEAGIDPHVEISATRTESTITVTVADNGPGIPDRMEEDVFEIFNRGSQHDTSGTGIGLAVCRRIVGRHDGEIWVADTDGRGATFRFTLPATTEVTGDE